MILLHYRVKFRSFGITLGTVSGEADVTRGIGALLSRLALVDVGLLTAPKFRRMEIFNERGVVLALEGR